MKTFYTADGTEVTSKRKSIDFIFPDPEGDILMECISDRDFPETWNHKNGFMICSKQAVIAHHWANDANHAIDCFFANMQNQHGDGAYWAIIKQIGTCLGNADKKFMSKKTQNIIQK